ncbi:galactokinase [Enterococcus columbae]|uniref:Galactokinase n=1 Tax=Enterococcus columbae DSM 7374 = ATCC 51263 TaxID=1121865 RepID=S1NPE5_9ENTE|nr:galactokinase [Enterococcus columbae]EOT42466.1 galactokinase [Enterococcus columbae DSM 7374 = ATCC 51263]EOW87598.1 galactokinase [Enterococcus columbae DSM 7374 = ATCC 51263]OJG23152.1 galactokinase [Enterococcus columbae DSM 7374 = ATCC 51263]
MIELLKEVFNKQFGTEATGSYFAPGRINLIGEHTDYNGGHVFPASITIGTYGLARKREDKKVCLYSENFPNKGVITFDVDQLVYKKEDDWANYPKGVIKFIQETGNVVDTGFEIAFNGNIPNGAGLSSSASIELLTGVIVRDLFNLDLTMLDLVKIGKKVENEFIGVNSGIMDQFAIGMGKKDHALLLDTNTLEYEVIPAAFGEYVVAIMNTNKRRELADSKYNERRAECEEALRRLQTKLAIQSLGDLDEATFEANKALIGDETLIKRAKHAVTENQRTLKAKKALQSGNLKEFGLLLNGSHASLKDDYEVTGIELDTLVAAAQAHPSVLGARMTGAGFGGCAIALVKASDFDDFKAKVEASYLEKIGYATDIYQASIDDGARKL